MIPPRDRKKDSAGNETRERVTACRKRLRSHRHTPKTPVGCECEEDSGVPNAAFLDDLSGMRESFSSTELSPAALDGGNERPERLLTLRTQEVGIT